MPQTLKKLDLFFCILPGDRRWGLHLIPSFRRSLARLRHGQRPRLRHRLRPHPLQLDRRNHASQGQGCLLLALLCIQVIFYSNYKNKKTVIVLIKGKLSRTIRSVAKTSYPQNNGFILAIHFKRLRYPIRTFKITTTLSNWPIICGSPTALSSPSRGQEAYQA